MKSKSTKFLVVTALMAAVSIVLSYLEFVLPFLPPFLKVDISDSIAVFASFSYSLYAGLLISLIKNIIHITGGTSFGIGELANIIIGSTFIITTSSIFKIKKNLWLMITGFVIGILLTTTVACVANYYLLLPLYGMKDHITKISLIMSALIPFNLIKFSILSATTFLLYKYLNQYLNKNLG